MDKKNSDFLRSLVDIKNGTVDRRIFVDETIYQLEMERIFSRGWNFMCHESQIQESGDFFLNYIGDDSVIATRDQNGEVQVLLNTCRHRGNQLCRAEMGSVSRFVCPYHGWSYALDGTLRGVPGLKDCYHGELNRDEWGLAKAAKVESYKGFVFATLDPDAPTLHDFLGNVGRLGLDTIAAHGDVVVVDGVQKNRMGCNWKLAVDNLFDWYHPPITHISALMTGYAGDRVPWDDKNHVVALGEYGHAISGPRMTREMREDAAKHLETSSAQLREDESWRDTPSAQEVLGEFGAEQRGHPNIFPNLWVASSGTQLCLRLPRGPDCTEIWWFTLLDKNMPEEKRADAVSRANHFFGPAGLFEQDDGENWDMATRACKGLESRKYPMNVSMNLGRGVIKSDSETGVAYIDAAVNEHGQLWTYLAWTDWMVAEDWPELKRNHSIPTGVL